MPFYMKSKKRNILSFVSSSLLLLTLTILDILSIGTKLYRTHSFGESLEVFNLIVYIISCVVSQCVYSLTSKLPYGVCSGPIYESADMTRSIHDICEKYSTSAVESVTNAFIVVSASTLLFCGLSFILGKYKIGSVLQYLPKTALFGVMSAIGIQLVSCGIYEFNNSNLYWYLVFITLILILGAFYLESKFDTIFFLPGYSFLIVIMFYSVAYVFDIDIKLLRNYSLIPSEDIEAIKMHQFFKYLDIRKFKFSIFIRCIPSMINMILTNMIHITVNVPAFITVMSGSEESIKDMIIDSEILNSNLICNNELPLTQRNLNINDEFKSQAVSNFFTAFVGYPSYFINCTSYFFNKSGGISKQHSGVSGILLLLVLYIVPVIRGYLPSVLLAFLPVYIGVCFIKSNIVDHMCVVSYVDLGTILMVCLVGVFLNTVTGLLAGVLINCLCMLYAYSTHIHRDKELFETIDSTTNTLKFNTMLFSMTRDILFNEIDKTPSGPLIVDLTGCGYMDYESNEVLYKFLYKRSHTVKLRGCPFNLYTKWFNRYKTINSIF